MATLSREHVIASMLVTGVVVIVGFASGLGLRTTTTDTQAAAPGVTQAQPNAGTPLPEGGLPQAIQPPQMSMPGTDPTASGPAAAVQALPSDASAPGLPVSQPDQSTTPGQPVSTPPTSTVPGTPSAPSACLTGVAQQVADTANTVVAGLPVVSDATGTLGLTAAPDGSSPGALNTLLYTVTGYCAPAEPAAAANPAAPVQTLTSPLGGALPALPKVGG